MSKHRKRKRGSTAACSQAAAIQATEGKLRIPRKTEEGIARRREQVKEYMMRGVPKVVMAELLNVSCRTIHLDIAAIKERMGERIASTRSSGQKIDQEIGMITGQIEAVANAAMAEYAMAGAGAIKDRFLNTAAKALWIRARLLMETGVLPKAGDSVTVHNKTEVSFKERFGEANPLAALDDPVSRRKVLTAIEAVLRTSVEVEDRVLTVDAQTKTTQ
jgi:hypothetical protein